MPFSKINITLNPAQMSAIAAAIDEVINTLPVKFNLTKTERISLSNINNERYPYVQRAIENHGPNNPILVSGYAGTQAEAANDLVFYDQMKAHLLRLRQAIEIYEDTQQVAGSEAYAWTRELYRSAQAAAANQVPGADAVADDLADLFEGQGGGGTPPPPPVLFLTLTTNQNPPSPQVGMGIKGTSGDKASILWGDGLADEITLTGVYVNTAHTYFTPDIYTILQKGKPENITGLVGASFSGYESILLSPLLVNLVELNFSGSAFTAISIPAELSKLSILFLVGNNLDAASVNQILITINDFNTSNGTINVSGGTNATPTGAGIAAKNQLISRGWTVTTN